jgi:hypothetical protein
MRAAVGAVALSLVLAACGGGGSSGASPSSGTKVDVQAACAALRDLQHAADGLRGVDAGDPDASEAALARGIAAYRAAVLRFERSGPASLRVSAEAVRAAVAARDFTRATTARASIDAWSAANCR